MAKSSKITLYTEESGLKLDFYYGFDNMRRKTVLTDNGTITKTKYFFGSYETVKTHGRASHAKYHFLPGNALYVTESEEKSPLGDLGAKDGNMYYLHKDHPETSSGQALGSILTVSDQSGNKINDTEQSFDAWGRNRNPETWNYDDVQTGHALSLLNDRGYTSHEMLPELGLINMNGRLYDPILGRMLSPDNYVQIPDYTQNFNRYSYCWNNPLKFTDPSGDFFLGTIITAISDFVYTGFHEGGFDWTAPKKVRQDAWTRYDPTATWSQTNKAYKIDLGIFRYDKSYSGKGDFFRDAWQIISRFTPWEYAQTTWGKAIAHGLNTQGRVESVNNFHGATVLEVPNIQGKAGQNIGGAYIQVRKYEGIQYNASGYMVSSSKVLIHEYGHYRQSRVNGLLGYIVLGINSINNPSKTDKKGWAERDASFQGYLYLRQYYNMQGYTEYNNQNIDYLPLLSLLFIGL